eukprot:TRINITY_DN3571_c0_g1_i1.p1 TRINITY_DN3571_c0_g1~~TRINITY_DN3571_c0_g1_i1.p1  ORF type:complete len:138 (-),score=50.49 TRINITY_DN3571_c0_g1_i1:70-483(-)
MAENRVEGTFKMAGWEEKDITVLSPSTKITTVVASFESVPESKMVGKVVSVWSMNYSSFDPNDRHGAIATYEGYSSFQGSIDGKEGTLVMKDAGVYNKGADMKFSSVSANGELESFKAASGKTEWAAGQYKYLIDQQ